MPPHQLKGQGEGQTQQRNICRCNKVLRRCNKGSQYPPAALRDLHKGLSGMGDHQQAHPNLTDHLGVHLRPERKKVVERGVVLGGVMGRIVRRVTNSQLCARTATQQIRRYGGEILKVNHYVSAIFLSTINILSVTNSLDAGNACGLFYVSDQFSKKKNDRCDFLTLFVRNFMVWYDPFHSKRMSSRNGMY